MSDQPDTPGKSPSAEPPSADPPSAQARAAETRAVEAAAIRRRWITLGEGLAVVAVVISGLTLYNSWSERSSSVAEKAIAAKQGAAKAATLLLAAQPDHGGRGLALRPLSGDQTIQNQTIRFPTALGVAPVETSGEPRIEADWFDTALKKARAATGRPDDSRGDERLPVAIVTDFIVDGAAHRDQAIYDIGYTVEGRMISGHRVALRGLALVRRLGKKQLQGALDRRMASLMPPRKN